MNWTFRWAWCGPKDHVFLSWLFSYGYHPSMTLYIRILGLLLQWTNPDSIVKEQSK